MNLKTGRLTFDEALEEERSYVRCDWDEMAKQWTARIDHSLELCIPNGARELFIGKQDLPPDEFTRIIALETEDGELHPSLHVVRSADILVVGTFSGYVICIDMEELPALREVQRQELPHEDVQ